MLVYFAQDTGRSTVDEVGARLRSTPEVELVRYRDEAAAFAEAQLLFADQPAMRRLLREGDVPTSFRVTIVGGRRPDDLAREIETWPGVQQVEPPPTGLPSDPLDPKGSTRSTGWLGNDRVIEQVHTLAMGAPAGIDPSTWRSVRTHTPPDLVAEVEALDPLVDVGRPAPVPTAADRAAAQAVVDTAAARCDLHPRTAAPGSSSASTSTTEPG